ncbi:MAG: hypothetical protein K2X03_02655 [Bryobacteraceae bacterium]|nr:hypothetical protein [Bryobacteraceae bacterium]
MRKYQVKESSFNVKVGFRDLLSHLPVPGTDDFDDLRLLLKPFGLRSDKCSVEQGPNTQNTKLSEVRVNFSLMSDKVIVRVAYDNLEIVVPVNEVTTPEAAVGIAEAFLSTMAQSQETAVSSVTIQSMAHLKIEDDDARIYLAEQIRTGNTKLVPDAFAVEIDALEGSSVKACRVVVARSLRFEQALFLDFAATYEFEGSFVPADFLATARADYAARLELLGLDFKGSRR